MVTESRQSEARQAWSSKLGFVLAASGSAIGLGNIVFFGANAYRYGGGAFYVPYLVALGVVGIPLMVLEFRLGQKTQRAFPSAMRQVAGVPGELAGWWALLNTGVVAGYYCTLLAWVVGMMVGSFGPLWQPTHPTPSFTSDSLPNPGGFFFEMLASPSVILSVAVVWLLIVLICSRGTKTIEPAVRVFVPAMWVMMVVLIVRGVTLPNGWQGVAYLFNPDFSLMAESEVWRGAFAQMFFSLSLGFGLLCTYASYLPKSANVGNFATQTSLLNCSFEYLAGFAIFSMLFAFAIVPQASTLSMTFFVLPQGIAQLPAGTTIFGILFFLLLLLAGLSSGISMVEAIVAAVIDKWGVRRRTVLTWAFGIGVLTSTLFALPKVIDPGLGGNGTLGLTLLDLFDARAFSFGLLVVGLAESVLIAWVYGIGRFVREGKGRALGVGERLFMLLVGGVIPLTLAYLLVAAVVEEVRNGLYGGASVAAETIGTDAWEWLAGAVPIVWGVGTVALAGLLCAVKGRGGAESEVRR